MDPKEGMTEQMCGKDANEGMSKDANEGMSTHQSATHCIVGWEECKGRAEDVLSRIIPKFGGSGILDAAAIDHVGRRGIGGFKT